MKQFTVVLLLVALCSVGYGMLDDESYRQWMEQGKEQVKQGDLKEARESFQTALLFKPNDAEAKKGIRMAEERMGIGQSATGYKASSGLSKNKDQKDFSIRVLAGNAPGVDEVEVGGTTESISGEGGVRVEVLAVKRFIVGDNPDTGWAIGGGIFFAEHSGKYVVGDEVDISAFGGIIQGSFITKTGENVIWEFGPYMGIGLADHEITGLTADQGAYALFGVKGGAYVMLGSSIELGVELGFEAFSSGSSVSDGVATADYTFTGGGPRVAGVLAVKF